MLILCLSFYAIRYNDYMPMQNTRRVLSGTALQFSSRIYSLILSIGSVAIMTRTLGVKNFGTYSLIVAGVAIVGAVADAGLNTMALKEISGGGRDGLDRLNQYLSIKALLLIAISVLVMAAVLFLPLPPLFKAGFAIYILSLLLNGVVSAIFLPFQSRLDFLPGVIVEVVTRTLMVAALVMLYVYRQSISQDEALLIVLGVGTIISALAFLYAVALARRRNILPKLVYDKAIWKVIAKASVPLTAVSILGILNYRVDMLTLAFLKGSEAVGIYSIAYRFIEVALPFSSLFMGAVFPVLVARSVGSADDGGRYKQMADRALKFLLLISVPAAAIGLALSTSLIHVLGGCPYLPKIATLNILIVSLPITFTTMLVVQLLIAKNLQRTIVPLSIFGVVLNIVLNFVLVPIYSYNGAAFSTLLSEIIGMGVILVILYRQLHIRFDAGEPVLITLAGATAGVMALVLDRTFGHNLFISAGGGVATFIVLIYFFQVITVQEIKELRKG